MLVFEMQRRLLCKLSQPSNSSLEMWLGVTFLLDTALEKCVSAENAQL